MDMSKEFMKNYEESREEFSKIWKNRVMNRDVIFEDRTVYSQVLGELERRKNYNCEKYVLIQQYSIILYYYVIIKYLTYIVKNYLHEIHE